MCFRASDKRGLLSFFLQPFFYCSRLYHSTPFPTTPPENGSSQSHLLSRWSFMSYLREEMVLRVAGVSDCSDNMLPRNLIRFLICAPSKLPHSCSNSQIAFSINTIFHQISLSCTIIVYFCEIPNFMDHILLLLSSCCETLHS